MVLLAKVPSGMIAAMETLPCANSFQTPSVRLVLPGFGSVRRSSASFFMNSRAATFWALLIVQLSPCFQSPPLPHMNSENSAWASSAPSGSP
jgi:hypothetical protein